ncbi:MAG: hypothetical protein HFJ33_01295 [Clostridia bacterium]|nr:hypothetical protein [Clostridia bacterium]
MQKKTDKFLDKIVKKDYNNELEKILEKKAFDENTKSLLLSILYKIETAYQDYEKVKPDVEEKDVFIQAIIDSIKNNCDVIKVVKLNSKESEMLGTKTFLVEKKKKRIICYPIERKLLYCIAKINKREKIVKVNYPIIDKTLTDLINVGNNINIVEPMRDFNGYSWTTIPREIESIFHNLVYQNMRILVGHQFLNNWIKNTEYIIDYMETFQDKLEEKYGKEYGEEWIQLLSNISVLLAIRYNPILKSNLQKEKIEVEKKWDKVQDNQKFVQELTQEKRQLTKQIKQMDETLNNKEMLQEEYRKRNEFLPLEEKIFSSRILSKMMAEERTEKLNRLEKINTLLNPQKFVAFKKELEIKEKYLKFLEIQNLDEEIEKSVLCLQKVFLACYQRKIEKIVTKQDMMKMIYEFRYYCLLPFCQEKSMSQVEEIEQQIQEVEMRLIKKAQEFKLMNVFSNETEIDYQILKSIFRIRVINLENLYIKVIKEKENYFVQIFDEDIFEEKIEMEIRGNENKKELLFKLNKKIKIFN